MSKRQLDLLLVNDIASQYYITAYDGWSFYTPQVVIVPMDGEPIWIGRSVDAAGGRLTAWMKPENVVGFPEDHVQTAARHPMDWIGKFITDKGWGKARIGVELEAYYYSPKAHMRLVASLPNATFVDADLLVSWIRAVKSPAEIEHMRKGATLVESAMRKAYEVIEPGVRECDAVAAIQAVQYAGSPDFAGDFTALPPIIMAGENAAAPHLMWSDRKYTHGETISLELAAAYRHYTAALARTMQLGSKPKKVADVEAAVLEGMNAVLANDSARRGGAGRRSGLAKRHRAPRLQEGVTHRVLDRHRLPAGLGRAHDLAAPRRHDGPAGGQHASRDHGHVDGWLGHRDQRDDPGDREWLRDPRKAAS